MRFTQIWLAAVWMLWSVVPVDAHEILHTTTEGGAVIVTLTYGDGSPFSFESYELFRPGEDVPVQVGRTDRAGRIVFIPGVGGTWRIRAFSEDGHGADFTVDAGAKALTTSTEPRSLGRHEKILIGVGCILGIFGIISLWCRRRRA